MLMKIRFHRVTRADHYLGPSPQSNNPNAGGIITPTAAQHTSVTWLFVAGLANSSLWSLQNVATGTYLVSSTTNLGRR